MQCKKILLVICVIWISHHSFACLSATQVRIFPVGTCKQGLVVVEADLHRTSGLGSNYFIKEWYGITCVKILDAKQQTVSILSIDTLMRCVINQLNDSLNGIIEQAILEGIKLEGFTPMHTATGFMGGYNQKAGKISLQTSIEQRKLWVNLGNGKKYSIWPLLRCDEVAKYVCSRLSNGGDSIQLINNASRQLMINSVRTYQIGNQAIMIVHLGVGDNESTGGFKNVLINWSAKYRKTGMFEEEVLHHGKSFDFVIWL